MITTIDKALVPLVVSAILLGLGHFGITGGMSVGELLTMGVTAGLVWFVPNK